MDANGVRPRGAHTNFTLNPGVKTVAFVGGTRVSGGCSEVRVWLRTGPSSPRWALLGRAEEERESSVEMRA